MNETIAFGEWLRQRRKALDLTQEVLAARVGCSPETIRKIEAGARRPSREMVEILVQRLAVPPEERSSLVEFARVGIGSSAPAIASTFYEEALSSAPITNLPRPLTTFIGRQKEMEVVRSLLWRIDVRLLTLTGAGGSGKTRCAIQVANDLCQDFQDGAFFISLAPITNPDLVASTIARTFGVPETPGQSLLDSIKSYLGNKQMLLLLDNFEQVLEAAPLVAELLSHCANVKVLVTSREPLHLYGEHQFSIPPLQLPADAHVQSLEELYEYEAINLFVQRAILVQPHFMLTDDNAAAVTEVCRRLDGLPLAIELAAARINVLPPHAMLSRMQDRLSLLTKASTNLPERQQTLRNTIEWSYNLLSENEARLFRRLAIFSGGCTFEAIQSICSTAEAHENQKADVLEALAALIDKSLVKQISTGGEPRFSMLETIAEYARERLHESGEAADLRYAHARFFMEFAERALPHLTGPDQVEWLARLELEHDNIRAALSWAKEMGSEDVRASQLGLRIAVASWRFWTMHSHMHEGQQQLEAMLSIGASAPPLLRAMAFRYLGNMLYYQGDYAEAAERFAQSLSIAREEGDEPNIAASLVGAGLVLFCQGDYELAQSRLEEGLTLRREEGNPQSVANSLTNLGFVLFKRGDIAGARHCHLESLALYRGMDDRRGVAFSLFGLGQVALCEGKHNEALSLFQASLAIRAELGDKWGIADALGGVAQALASGPQAREAAALFGATQSFRDSSALPLPPYEKEDYSRSIKAACSTLGEAAFAQAWSRGLEMVVDAAIARALDVGQGEIGREQHDSM